MTHRHDDADPIEHDPTGMRALLGSLPDPGPMPEDLVARITAALEEEARHQRTAPGVTRGVRPSETPAPTVARPGGSAGGDPTAGPRGDSDGDPRGDVVPLHRRRVWQLLGVAAAAVVALGVGGLVVDQLSPGGLQASLGLASGATDSVAAESDAAGDAPAASSMAPDEQTGRVATDDALHVVVLASGGEYTQGDLADRAADLAPEGVADPGSPEAGPLDETAGTDQPLASPSGARACASVIGVDPSEPLLVDLAAYEGHRAAVIVATGPDGSRRAWAVRRDCRAGSPGVLAGPVQVR